MTHSHPRRSTLAALAAVLVTSALTPMGAAAAPPVATLGPQTAGAAPVVRAASGFAVATEWPASGQYVRGDDFDSGLAADMYLETDEVPIAAVATVERKSGNAASTSPWTAVYSEGLVDEDGFFYSYTSFEIPEDSGPFTYRWRVWGAFPGEGEFDMTSSATATYSWVNPSIDDVPPTVVRIPTQVSVDLPRVQARLGQRLSVTGRVSTPKSSAGAEGREVHLRLATRRGDGDPIARAVTDAEGRFSLNVPTNFLYARQMYATVTQAGREYNDASTPGRDLVRFAAAESTQKVRAVVTGLPYGPRGKQSDHALLFNTSFSSCAPLGYRVNPAMMPKGGMRLIKETFRQIAQATGYRFAYEGSTNRVPFSGNNPWISNTDRRSDITIAWSTPARVPGLRGGTIGRGGGSYGYGLRGDGDGGVVLDASQLREARKRLTPKSHKTLILMVLLHEVGHAMGLDHPAQGAQTMSPSVPRVHRGLYEAGDLAGLAAVAALDGCDSTQRYEAQRTAAARPIQGPRERLIVRP